MSTPIDRIKSHLEKCIEDAAYCGYSASERREELTAITTLETANADLRAKVEGLEANHADIDWYRDDNHPVYEVRVDGPVAAYAKSIRAAIDAARKEGV